MKNYILLLLCIVCLNNLTAQVADNFLIKAGILNEIKQYEEALEAIKQSGSIENKNYTKILADIYYGLKNHQQATDLYLKLETSSPGSFLIELSRSYAMAGNMQKAMEHLNSYFLQKNKLPISKIINDEVFLKFRNNKEWEEMWQKIDYSELELKVNQVNTASENGYNEYLNSVLNDAIRKYPSNAELLYHQSKYYMDKKMYAAAQKAITQALNQKTTDRYFYHKSQVEQKINNHKEALTSINEAIKRNPFVLQYYLTRMDLNRSLGNKEMVNEDVKFIEFCVPENPDVQMAKIKIEADKGNYLNAIDGLTTLIENDKANQEYYIFRGKMCLKMQRLQDADEDFGMALDLSPFDAEANLGKGIAKFKMDDITAACYYWQKASNEGNREALDYLNKNCGK